MSGDVWTLNERLGCLLILNSAKQSDYGHHGSIYSK